MNNVLDLAKKLAKRLEAMNDPVTEAGVVVDPEGCQNCKFFIRESLCCRRFPPLEGYAFAKPGNWCGEYQKV